MTKKYIDIKENPAFFREHKKMFEDLGYKEQQRVLSPAIRSQTSYMTRVLYNSRHFQDHTFRVRSKIIAGYGWYMPFYPRRTFRIKKGVGYVNSNSQATHNLNYGHKKGVVKGLNKSGNRRGGWGPARPTHFFTLAIEAGIHEGRRRFREKFRKQLSKITKQLAAQRGISVKVT